MARTDFLIGTLCHKALPDDNTGRRCFSDAIFDHAWLLSLGYFGPGADVQSGNTVLQTRRHEDTARSLQRPCSSRCVEPDNSRTRHSSHPSNRVPGLGIFNFRCVLEEGLYQVRHLAYSS